jgi:predicted esterase
MAWITTLLPWLLKYGPTLLAMLSALFGGALTQNHEKVRAASPLSYASKEDGPFLVLHGTADSTVPPQQSEAFVSALKRAGELFIGQQVRSGEQVAIIEAMKMQNIIRAERDGVVKAVLVASGASVAADEVLIEFG